jgi:hypothetical protein
MGMGAVRIVDGAWALPLTARNQRSLDALADEVGAVGGKASVWAGFPTHEKDREDLVEESRSAFRAGYHDLAKRIHALARKPKRTQRRVGVRLERRHSRLTQADPFEELAERRAAEAALVELERPKPI